MDRAITATDANQRFSEMLREVQAGASFVVTSRGRPIAKVSPVDEFDQQVERLRELNAYVANLPIGVLPGWRREDLYE